VAFYAAGRFDVADEAAKLASRDPAIAGVGQHLLGLIRAQQQNPPAAIEALNRASEASDPATRDHALALRGTLAWHANDFADAVRSWGALPDERRRE